MAVTEAIVSRRFFRSDAISLLRKTPLYICTPGGFHSRNFERIEGSDAAIKKEQIGLGSLGMARVDSFVLAVQNPPAIEHTGHPGHLGSEAIAIAHRLSIVQRHSSKRPDFGASRGAVDSIPAIHKLLST